jgi:hypothetical protein
MNRYTKFSLTEIKRAIKKLEIMTDKIVDLLDMGFGESILTELQTRTHIMLHGLYSEERERYGG